MATQKDKQMMQSLFYLSITTGDEAAEAAVLLDKKTNFVQGLAGQYFRDFLSQYKKTTAFPAFRTYVAANAIQENDPECLSYDPDDRSSFKNVFTLYVQQAEVKYYANRLSYTSEPKEMTDTVNKLSKLLAGTRDVDDGVLTASRDIDMMKFAVDQGDGTHFTFPAEHLNEKCGALSKGCTLTIMGGPRMGKSSFAQNFVYQNGVDNGANILYFYLEDVMERYQCNLLSKFSYLSGGARVPSYSMKVGVDSGNEKAKETIRNLQMEYSKYQKGNIYFMTMGNGLSNEPMILGRQLGKIIIDKKIDMIVVDYIQKFKAFLPPAYQSKYIDYLNQVASMFTSLALGMYDNPKVLNVILSQLNREGQTRVERSKGKMTIYDAAEVNSIERDSHVILGVYTDNEMKEAHELSVQILKNRDNGDDGKPNTIFFDPQYCQLGDVQTTWNRSALSAIWDTIVATDNAQPVHDSWRPEAIVDSSIFD